MRGPGDLLADGAIQPRIAAVWQLRDVRRALNDFAKGSLPGKRIIAIPPPG